MLRIEKREQRSQNAKECNHMRLPFSFDKHSHVMQIVAVWRQKQPLHMFLNSHSTCFGSKFRLDRSVVS